MPNNKRTVGALLGLHAQTSVHAGTGTAFGAVDLPVQRERHTAWPNFPGSSLKGILRDACREQLAMLGTEDLRKRKFYADDAAVITDDDATPRQLADATLDLTAMFGPPTAGAAEFAGALSLTDARTVAFPVRSLKGVFAWVTCPAALDRLKRDASLASLSVDWNIPILGELECVVPADCPCVIDGKAVVFEEFDFERVEGEVGSIASWIADTLISDGDPFADVRAGFQRRMVLVSDEMFTHFVRHATEVTARIALDYENKTVKKGALFYQEFLPAETMLYAVVLANPSRVWKRLERTGAEMLGGLAETTNSLPFLQVGGDETTGKGLCAVRLARGEG